MRHEQKSRRQTTLLRNCAVDEGKDPGDGLVGGGTQNYLPPLRSRERGGEQEKGKGSEVNRVK